MKIIHMDCPVTRRTRVHAVIAYEDQLVFTSPSLDEVLSWLIDQGEVEAILASENHSILITLIDIPVQVAPQVTDQPP